MRLIPPPMRQIFNALPLPSLPLKDVFPRTSQNPPPSFTAQAASPPRTSLLTQLVASQILGEGNTRYKRNSSLERSQLSDVSSFHNRSDPVSSEQRQPVLVMLNRYLRKIQNRSKSPRLSAQQKATLHQVVHAPLKSISAAIQNVQHATSLQQICKILAKLQNAVFDSAQSIRNIASPLLVAKFVDQISAIWLDPIGSTIDELKKTNLKESLSNALKTKILNCIQAHIADAERFQNADAGTLPENFVRQLRVAFERRKNILFQKTTLIQNAQSNEEVYLALPNLGKAVTRDTRRLKPLLKSPQYNLQERLFTLSGEIFAMRRTLGETF